MIKATLDGQPNCYKFTIFTMIIYQEIYQAEHEASDEPNDAPKLMRHKVMRAPLNSSISVDPISGSANADVDQ